MKNYLIILSVALMSLMHTTASATIFVDPTDENPIVEHVDNTVFNTINVSIPATINIYEGDNFDIGIKSINEIYLRNIKYEIKNGTLKIWMDNIPYNEILNINSDSIRIAIMVPNKVKILTSNSKLQLVSSNQKHKKTTSYENN